MPTNLKTLEARKRRAAIMKIFRQMQREYQEQRDKTLEEVIAIETELPEATKKWEQYFEKDNSVR